MFDDQNKTTEIYRRRAKTSFPDPAHQLTWRDETKRQLEKKPVQFRRLVRGWHHPSSRGVSVNTEDIVIGI